MYQQHWFELRSIGMPGFLKSRLRLLFHFQSAFSDTLGPNTTSYSRVIPEMEYLSYHLGFDNKNSLPTLDIQLKPKYKNFYFLLKNILHSDRGHGFANHCNNGHCRRENVRLKKCSRCKKVRYCSRKCQKTDWKSKHRTICIAT